MKDKNIFILIFRTLVVATERLSTINVLVKHVKILNNLKSVAETLFNLVSMWWRIQERRLMGVSSQHFDSFFPMVEKQRPVNRHSLVLQTRKSHKLIYIVWINIFRKQFSVSKTSKLNCLTFKRRWILSGMSKKHRRSSSGIQWNFISEKHHPQVGRL